MKNGPVSTAEVLFRYQYTMNPVTKAVYRQILGNRIDRTFCADKERTK